MAGGIDLGKAGVAVGLGIADELLLSWDEKSGRTGAFKTATDWVRLIGTLGGYALQVWMPKQHRWGEALALSGTPLLVKSVAGPIRDAIGGSSVQVFTPRKRQPVSQSAARPQNIDRARYPAPAVETEMTGARLD